MENSDEDALKWAGDDARQRGGGTWSVPERRKGASLSPSHEGGFDTQTPSPTQPSDQPSRSSDSEADVSRQTTVADSIALVVTGVFAGIYLLFTVAWLITALRDPVRIADPLGEAMFVIGLWMAVAAVPAVFVASLIAGRTKLPLRFVWLVAGALVLIPWPYFTWAG
jgi:hypothetical protein